VIFHPMAAFPKRFKNGGTQASFTYLSVTGSIQ